MFDVTTAGRLIIYTDAEDAPYASDVMLYPYFLNNPPMLSDIKVIFKKTEPRKPSLIYKNRPQ